MRLTNPHPRDVAWIDGAIDQWLATRRWHLRGEPVSPMRLQHLLWDGVPYQQVVCSPTEQPIGLLQVTGLDLERGIANLDALVDGALLDDMQGPVCQFVQAVFAAYPLGRLFVWAASPGLPVERLLRAHSGCWARVATLDYQHRGGDVVGGLHVYEIEPPLAGAA